jgi:hypothetical protein
VAGVGAAAAAKDRQVRQVGPDVGVAVGQQRKITLVEFSGVV